MNDFKKQLENIKKEYNLNYDGLKYIDSHAHYLSRQFNKDRNDLINNLKNELDFIIECGTNTKSNLNVLNLCEEYDGFFKAVIGYFPCDVLELENKETLKNFKKLLENKYVIGIGEIGFDFYHNKPNKEIQEKWFKYQIELAKEYGLPVCIHSRDALDDTLRVIKETSLRDGIIHCYSYDLETAKKLYDLGFYFGIGGTSTYKNNSEIRRVIKEIPIDRLLLETDTPYLTPEPYRRDRNDSSYIKYVIKNIAELKEISEEDVINITNNNVKNAYLLSISNYFNFDL